MSNPAEDDRAKEPHAQWLAWYQRILAARRAEIVPWLTAAPGDAGEYEVLGEGAVRVRWRLDDRSRLTLVANVSDNDVKAGDLSFGRVLWREGEIEAGADRLGPWSLEKAASNPAQGGGS